MSERIPFFYAIALFLIFRIVVIFAIYFIFISLRGKMQFAEISAHFFRSLLFMITILITYMHKSCTCEYAMHMILLACCSSFVAIFRGLTSYVIYVRHAQQMHDSCLSLRALNAFSHMMTSFLTMPLTWWNCKKPNNVFSEFLYSFYLCHPLSKCDHTDTNICVIS